MITIDTVSLNLQKPVFLCQEELWLECYRNSQPCSDLRYPQQKSIQIKRTLFA
jgi:hypothetical protein